MANDVYANGREVSCKAGSGKTICAFPDVCFTPPENPATPPGVPIPYPNTGVTGDTTSGSKTVKISGKEVMLKNKSYFKTSTGDEAGCAAKKGILTSVNKGKVYFTAWSMDVKVEGENVVRHLDLTTHNHNPPVGQTPPWPFVDSMDVDKDPCATEKDNEQKACANPPPRLVQYQHEGETKTVLRGCSEDCKKAKACRLAAKENDKTQCCEPDNTGDHLIEVNCFTPKGGRKTRGKDSKVFKEFKGYDHEKAPTACARNPGALKGMKNNHNAMQAWREEAKLACIMAQGRETGQINKKTGEVKPIKRGRKGEVFHWRYSDAAAAGAASHHKVNPQCSEACTRAQLDKYHQHDPSGPKCGDTTPLRTDMRSWKDAQFTGGRRKIGPTYKDRSG